MKKQHVIEMQNTINALRLWLLAAQIHPAKSPYDIGSALDLCECWMRDNDYGVTSLNAWHIAMCSADNALTEYWRSLSA